MNKQFEKGQLVAYCPEDAKGNILKVEIGCFRKLNKSKTAGFVHFRMGPSAAACDLKDLYPIANDGYLVIGHTFNSLDGEN